MSDIVKAKITRIGWGGRPERFTALVEFPDGPPDWPISVVLCDRPVYMSLVPPTPSETEPA